MHHLHLTASYLGKTDQTVVMIKTKNTWTWRTFGCQSSGQKNFSLSHCFFTISSEDYPHLDDLIVLWTHCEPIVNPLLLQEKVVVFLKWLGSPSLISLDLSLIHSKSFLKESCNESKIWCFECYPLLRDNYMYKG